MARDDDDGNAGIVALDGFQDLDPVHPAALQPDVQDDQVRRRAFDCRERAIGVVRGARGIAFITQQVRDDVPYVRLVIHNQNVSHRLSRAPFCSSYVLA